MKSTMKTAITILFILVLSLPVMAAEETAPVREQAGNTMAEMDLLLNSFAALGEGHIESVLRGLRIIAATEEAQSGEWERIKGMLAAFDASGIKAATVWFILPDGTPYSVEKGLTTDLNVRDREYFPRLFAGEEVIGDLVISKSTGMRTAIVAVPIKKNGKVIGALGASLKVEDISRMLDQKMGLPENMFFYALDQKGRTSLHRTSELLMAYPSDMGSKSLANTVADMLAKPEGIVNYDFYGERTVAFRKYPLTGWVYAVGVPIGKAGTGAELPPILSELDKEIMAELNRLDRDVSKLAGSISEKNMKAAKTRTMLAELCKSYSYAVDCAIVDRSGAMIVVEPAEYAKFEGSDIGSQEQMVRLRKTKKPVLSNVIRTVEGFDAVDLEHPILSQGRFAGSVSILFRPENLFSHVLVSAMEGVPVEAFVMQKDGRVIYEQDKEEIGRMIFEDPMYKPFPQLIAVMTMASKQPQGAGSYDFKQTGTEKMVKKDAHWTTVGLHGTEWRLVVMHVRTGHAVPAGAPVHADALRILAESKDMKKACSRQEDTKVREILKKFYSEHHGLYSIQWLDSRGVNRCGYPEENSLINIDMKVFKSDSAKPMLDALEGRNERSFDSPLVEGKTGSFLMVPVYEGGEYLGMIYTITIKE